MPNRWRKTKPGMVFNLLLLLRMIPDFSLWFQDAIPQHVTVRHNWNNLWSRLRWSRSSVLAFGAQVRGFKPGRSRRIFKGEKILSMPSFRGEVKQSVPCRRFAACKRSLELRGSRILDETCRNISRLQRVLLSAARGLSRRWTWMNLAEKVGTSKGEGKQWQPIPKNLPRMQCARAIPVAWLGSGSC
jgi:hypothetical protein